MCMSFIALIKGVSTVSIQHAQNMFAKLPQILGISNVHKLCVCVCLWVGVWCVCVNFSS